MKFSQTVNKVIALSASGSRLLDRRASKAASQYPFIHEGDEDGPPPPEEKKLKALLASLPEDAIYKLVLIMSIGRRIFGTDHLAEHYEELKERFETPEWAMHNDGRLCRLWQRT